MRILFLVAFLQFGTMLHAQVSGPATADSVDVKPKKIVIGIVPSYSASQLKGSMLSFAGVGVNAQFSQRLNTRIFVSLNIDNYSLEILFPSEHIYDQSAVGIDLSWVFFSNRITPVAGVMISYSKIGWEPMEPTGEQFYDYLWLASPYLGGKWNITKNLQLELRGGYNFAGDMDLIGFSQGDFDSYYLEMLIVINIARL